MINNNMIQLAATTHQRELHRAATEPGSAANHGSDTAAASRHARLGLTRMLHGSTGRRPQRGNAVPRLSI